MNMFNPLQMVNVRLSMSIRRCSKEDMQAGIDAQKELLAQQAVWDQLIADTVVENYPEDLLKAKEEAYMQNDQEGAELEGISFEDYVEQNLNMTLDEYNQEVICAGGQCS